jgi:hypothetical protein
LPNRLGRHEKLLLAFDAMALSETFGRDANWRSHINVLSC